MSGPKDTDSPAPRVSLSKLRDIPNNCLLVPCMIASVLLNILTLWCIEEFSRSSGFAC